MCSDNNTVQVDNVWYDNITLTADTRSVMLYVTLTADTRSVILDVTLTGKLVTMFGMTICLGQFIASVVCGGFSGVEDGWRWMLGLALVPSFGMGIGMLFLPESPRYMVRPPKSASKPPNSASKPPNNAF